MSGGVDSSVAAALLREQGYQVVGATMKLLDLPDELYGDRGCCSLDAVRRAQAVCGRLDIPHYTLNFVADFQRDVIAPFVAEYAAGRTPNPCLRCNLVVKWGELLRRARGAGCEYLATGHYARRERGGGRWVLRRGLDQAKDQSYALYGLSQEALAYTLLPLGEMTKPEVRAIAARLGLPTAETEESQDLCFVPGGDCREFLRERIPFRPGPIVDEQGRVLGEHEGLPAYTVGQRKGLRLGGGGEPLFVLAKDARGNRLVVGPRESLARREVGVEQVNWVSRAAPPVGKTIRAEVELRYRGKLVPAEITVKAGNRASLRLAEHDQAVTPGQAAVWYEGEVLLGGGLIF
jgi:tRNA-specific 2-thiouridylase